MISSPPSLQKAEIAFGALVDDDGGAESFACLHDGARAGAGTCRVLSVQAFSRIRDAAARVTGRMKGKVSKG